MSDVNTVIPRCWTSQNTAHVAHYTEQKWKKKHTHTPDGIHLSLCVYMCGQIVAGWKTDYTEKSSRSLMCIARKRESGGGIGPREWEGPHVVGVTFVVVEDTAAKWGTGSVWLVSSSVYVYMYILYMRARVNDPVIVCVCTYSRFFAGILYSEVCMLFIVEWNDRWLLYIRRMRSFIFYINVRLMNLKSSLQCLYKTLKISALNVTSLAIPIISCLVNNSLYFTPEV